MSSRVPGLLLYHLVEVVIIFFNLVLRLIQLPLDHNTTTIYQITLRKVKRISGTRLSPVLRLQRRPRVILRSPPPPPYSELNTFWTEEDSPLLHNGRGSRSPTTPTTATRGTSTGCRRRRRCRSGPPCPRSTRRPPVRGDGHVVPPVVWDTPFRRSLSNSFSPDYRPQVLVVLLEWPQTRFRGTKGYWEGMPLHCTGI